MSTALPPPRRNVLTFGLLFSGTDTVSEFASRISTPTTRAAFKQAARNHQRTHRLGPIVVVFNVVRDPANRLRDRLDDLECATVYCDVTLICITAATLDAFERDYTVDAGGWETTLTVEVYTAHALLDVLTHMVPVDRDLGDTSRSVYPTIRI